MQNLCKKHETRAHNLGRILGFNVESYRVAEEQCVECEWDAKGRRASRSQAAFIGGGRKVE